MKLVSNYNAVSIETALTAKDIKDIKNVTPDALMLIDNDDLCYFNISVAKTGGINAHSITFDSQTEIGTLYVTVCDENMPKETDKRRAYIEDKFGGILVKLAAVEQQVNTALTEYTAQIAAVSDSINVI